MNTKYPVWAIFGIVVLGAIAAWYYPQINQYSDIFYYEKIAADTARVRAGAASGEASAWYPPFAAAIFYFISLIPHVSFVQAWLGFLVCIVAFATAYVHWGLRVKKAYLLPFAIIGCIVFLGIHITLARYDILVGLMILLSYVAYRARQYGSSIAWILLAGGLKAVPLALLPLILLAMPLGALKKAVMSILIGILVVAGLPMLIIGPEKYIQHTKDFTVYHSARGFQIESTFSGVDMLAKNMLHQQADAAFHHFATHNMDLEKRALTVSVIALTVGLLYLYWTMWKRRGQHLDIFMMMLAALAWILFTAPVFSPQFLLWVFPLALLWIFEHGVPWKVTPRETKYFIILLAIIAFGTQWIYPWHYRDFVQQKHIFTTLVLNVRNVAMLGLFVLFAVGTVRIHIPKILTREVQPLTLRQKKIVTYVMAFITIAFVVYICSFKILDRDFWWHIKAGEIMMQTKQLISIEPFAYTREGKPYIATQSWLAEGALYGIYAGAGTNGIIIFRTLTMIFVLGLLLAINKKQIWLMGLFAILAANAMQGAFIERPQLFTFSMFALFVYLALRVLEKGLSHTLALAFIVLEILWVNLHGAAAFLGIFIIVCLALQRAYVQRRNFTWKPWAYLSGGMILAFFISPSGYHNITYMFQLLNDKTIIFIEEWQPREWAVYLSETILLWIAVLWSLWSTRRNWVFCTLLLAGTGYLSRTALRHEVLFVIAAFGITIYQLKYNATFARFTEYLAKRQLLAGLLLVLSLVSLLQYTKNHYQNFAQQDQLFGYGVFTPAKGAYEFIEKNNLTGNMFNTYGIGGYLLNQGYPNRKVYIDGRNVDYGYDFMNATYEAGLDGEHWQKVEDEYNITYAVIDYMAIANVGRAGFSVHLDKNPQWLLVYLDDWTGVYVKDTSEHKKIISEYSYTELNPINFDNGQALDTLTAENKEALVRELQRVADSNADGVKARLLLARIYISDGAYDSARQLLLNVLKTQPYLADSYQLLGTIALAQQQWIEAANYYSQMLKRTGKAYPDINYRAIADVFAKAGHPLKAAYYRWLAKPVGETVTTPGVDDKTPNVNESANNSPVTQDTISNLFAGIAQSLSKYNDEGAAFGEQGKFPEAKESFMEALKLDPGNPQTLNNLGVLSLQTGAEAAALDYFTRSFERTDEYPDAHYNLAILQYRQQKYTEALQEAEKAQKYGRDSKGLIEAIKAKLK